MDPSAALEKARAHRARIHQRLCDEDETDLAELLAKCGQPLLLICTRCGHHHPVETKCRQKWCPVCVRAIATKRSMKFAAAAAAMQWPLFITLTVDNIVDQDNHTFIRKLRRDFGKLRHRKIWKNNVRGGVAAIEVTRLTPEDRRRRGLSHIGDTGWHPHLHALVDCEWLAIKTLKPQWGASRAMWKAACKAAHREFSALWQKASGSTYGICWIQRADGERTAREVLKYSVKGSDLAEAPGLIGPLIRQLRATRLTTSFGTLFGKHLIRDANERPPLVCDGCHQPTEWLPEPVLNAIIRKRS